MNCLKLENVVSLYLAGELDSERSAAVESHLRACPTCAAEIERQKDIDAYLCEGVLRPPVDSAPIERRVKQAIQSEARTFSRRFAFRRWLGIAASVVLFASVSALFYQRWILASPVYAAVAHDYSVEVLGQVHRVWLADHSQIAALASQQGISAAALEALAPSNYSLERAMLCPLNGSRYLHLVYTDGGHEMSIYLHPADATRLSGFALDSENGKYLHSVQIGDIWLAGFRSERYIAIVATDQSKYEALSVARSVARAL